jgi:hypothetical protein
VARTTVDDVSELGDVSEFEDIVLGEVVVCEVLTEPVVVVVCDVLDVTVVWEAVV